MAQHRLLLRDIAPMMRHTPDMLRSYAPSTSQIIDTSRHEERHVERSRLPCRFHSPICALVSPWSDKEGLPCHKEWSLVDEEGLRCDMGRIARRDLGSVEEPAACRLGRRAAFLGAQPVGDVAGAHRVSQRAVVHESVPGIEGEALDHLGDTASAG